MIPLVLRCLLITLVVTDYSLARGVTIPKTKHLIEANQIPHQLQLTNLGPSKLDVSKRMTTEDGKTTVREGRAMVPPMEMLDPRRHPKPKPPIGNDIGMARIRSLPDEAYSPRIPDRMEATVSIGYTMATKREGQDAKDEEAKVVSRELHEIMESVPNISLPNFPIEFQRDPEQEAINQRITEVARQLTEAALRKEYENGQLRKVLPLPQESRRSSQEDDEITIAENQTTDEIVTEEQTSTEVFESTTQEITTVTDVPKKSAKSLDISKAQPLVSHISLDGQSVQLLADAQSVPFMMVNEGFLSTPQFVGPLLGGPPISQDGITVPRTPKLLREPIKPQPTPVFESGNIPNFLKIVSPRYKFSSNDLVVSVPLSGVILPAIISGKNNWWTDPSYKKIAEMTPR